ncbi:hypothetical protein HU147_09920 [Planomicrobium chinense]|uniref:hypothetical protein n=1 Tax=Planococcus chinensis TaxID=272917 RepID=UPI001CC7168A|nr:hypothetical protein [Planococcus chinensis]MBZ5201531.1 hypothetical protein [Planococcus chinensis]
MGLFRFLFMKKKCLVHTAFGNERYYSAASKLSAHGISYDVVRKSNMNMGSVFGGGGQSAMPFVQNAEINNAKYDFYVTKEDEHLALRALR